LRLYAFVANAGDGTVSVVDLIRVSKIATIAVGPHRLDCGPIRNSIKFGVSQRRAAMRSPSDSASGQILARIFLWACRPSLSISRQTETAPTFAASGSSTLVAIDCRTGQIVDVHGLENIHGWREYA